MHIQIEMSAAQWHTLLGYLDPNSPAFSIVKSAIETNEAPITTPLAKVALTCDENDAAVMLHAAQTFFPKLRPASGRLLKADATNNARRQHISSRRFIAAVRPILQGLGATEPQSKSE